MNICPECGFRNRNGVDLCAKCLRRIGGSRGRDTMTVPVRRINARIDRLGAADMSSIGQHQHIVLRFHNGMPPYILPLRGQVILGRRDNGASRRPFIDLVPYGAFTSGVSRLHAAICRYQDEAAIIDLESANGTFVNGERLEPYIPFQLHSGDVVALGNLAMTLKLAEMPAGAA